MADDRFYPPVANLRGIERLKIRPSREALKHVLVDALQTALGLKAKGVHGRTWVAAHAYVREETREAEGVVAGMHLHLDGRLSADFCGQDSGTIFFEADGVTPGPDHTADDVAKAAAVLAARLAEARAEGAFG